MVNEYKVLTTNKVDFSITKKVSTAKIASVLLTVMKLHIGLNNSINKMRLFKQIFGCDYESDSAACWLLWDFTKKAMRLLRTQSNCFIANAKTVSGEYVFFVVSNQYDADCYIEQLNRSIKNMRMMQQKVVRAVKERWCTQTWKIGYVPVQKQIRR